MVELRIDQFQRNHLADLAGDQFTNSLQREGGAADTITTKQRLSAEQCVAGTFEVEVIRQRHDFQIS